MFCNHQQNNWSELLHLAKFTYNNHYHLSISMSPFKANVGYDMDLTGSGPTQDTDTPLRLAHLKRLHKQCKLWIDQAQKKQQKTYDKCHKDTPPLMVGDLVWISSWDISTDRPSPKLDALQYGPFRVQWVMGPLNYQIEIPAQWRIHNMFHQSKLHKVPPETIPN